MSPPARRARASALPSLAAFSRSTASASSCMTPRRSSPASVAPGCGCTSSTSTLRPARAPRIARQLRNKPKSKTKSSPSFESEHWDMASDILIVDDKADICELVAGLLQDEGYGTRTARDSDSALNEIKNRRPNLVFLDIWLQARRLDGLPLLDSAKEIHPGLRVVMISGHGNVETAVAAIKRGAYDFIEKPFKSDRLILVATRALETSRLKREVKELKQLAPSSSTLM